MPGTVLSHSLSLLHGEGLKWAPRSSAHGGYLRQSLSSFGTVSQSMWAMEGEAECLQ